MDHARTRGRELASSPPPSHDELAEQLHDRWWNDPRARDDRTEFTECEACGRAVRWIANLGSARGGSIQIVARALLSGALFDPGAHAGMVAVWPDRTGFTAGRATELDEVEGALLYRCHWDVCDHARVVRDRISAQRSRSTAANAHGEGDADVDTAPGEADALRRYEAWLRARAPR